MLDKRINKICKDNEFSTPLELLVGLTNGVDLRKENIVHRWLVEYEKEYNDEPPGIDDWYALTQLIKHESKFSFVDVKDSLAAQKAILEYQHPKRKSIDLNVDSSGNAKVEPLTYSEIRKFKKKFNTVC